MQKNIDKINVGILTFHYAHNFGAALQAYAMKMFLQSNGYMTEIINYQNKKLCKRYQENLPFSFATRRRDWLAPWRWPNLIKSNNWRNHTNKDWQKQYTRFKEFQNCYLVDKEKQAISKDKICALSFDAIVYGSDQIWDTGITGKNETVYWGNHVNDRSRKIAYGASIYTTKLDCIEKKKVIKYLSSFYALAVREQALAKQIENILNRTVETVVDPTLLIPYEYYLKIINVTKIDKPYVLVYTVSDSIELLDAVQKLGLPIRWLHYYKSINLKSDDVEDIADAGPIEFLELIYGAEYVITNSFHGTVFSILFRKKFCAVYDKNIRIENLLEVAHMKEAHIKSMKDINTDRMVVSSNYNLEKLEKHVNISKNYLLNSLAM